LIVGADPSRQLRADAAHDPSVVITGRVDDVRPYLWKAAVSIAPIHTARGIQNKVLEAVACGLPAVVTPAVHDGLPAEVRGACRSAAGPESFATSVLALLSQPPAERRRVAAGAAIDRLAWESQLAPLAPILAAAAASRGGRIDGPRRWNAVERLAV
jgi:glycosyltransferase involved in cell wall biosynthesis